MRCQTVFDGNGKVIGIVCARGQRRPKPKCIACGKRPGTLLCDHKLAPDELRLAGQDTCDAPLCTTCRVPAGAKLDFCPHHKDDVPQLSLFG